MATSTIQSITATSSTWTEVFTASGVTSGSNIVIQNTGSSGVLIQTNTSNTPPTDNSGWALAPFAAVEVTAESYVFIKSGGAECLVHVEVE